MRSLTESPALLTVHRGAPGQYVIRVGDTRDRALIVGVTKLLADAESFVVVTPSDIKVFNANGSSSIDRGGTVGSISTDHVSDSVTETEVTDPEMLAAIAKEESRTLPNATVEEEPAPEQPRVVKRDRKKNASIAGHQDTCGRCQGTGIIQAILDGGSPAEVTCQICSGKGSIQRYGERR